MTWTVNFQPYISKEVIATAAEANWFGVIKKFDQGPQLMQKAYIG